VPDLLISDLAERSGVPASTLRYYEQQGLLPAARTPAGYRIYDQASVERLRFISAAKRLHLSLDSIRALLEAWEVEPCRTVKAQLRPKIQSRLDQVDQSVAELRELKESLRTALRRLDELPDRAAHCDPDCAFLTEGPARAPIAIEPPTVAVVIACSLDASAHGERMAQWRAVLADASVEQVARGVRLTLPLATATLLPELILAEQKCCPFLEFQLGFTASALRLMITADDEARAFIDDLVSAGRARRA
jgi:MerR family copper efflux transcriptional regulator